MTADADLPVWTLSPNWVDGVTERLSWLTDVLASSYGPEQRRALRLSPRREFEMKFNPVDQARSYFDLWLHRMGSYEFMAPLFHDAGKTTADVAAAASTIPIDTTYREFVVGGLAVMIGDDPFTFDKVEITAIADDHLSVDGAGVTQGWPKGVKVYPLRRSRISDESLFSALTSRVGEATLQFQLNQANDLIDEGEWDALYGTYPIILAPPNRRESLDLTFNRNSLVLDNDLGLRALYDDAGRAFTTQVDTRMMKGRAEHWAFRQMLYRLRGQQGTVWLPSFNRDVVLSRDALAADAKLDVKKMGYAYTGGVIDGRQYLLLPGGVGAAITAVGAPLSAKEERLTLAGPLGTAFAAGTFASFMDTCRLASDDIEIVHHTDTDGAAECNLGFRSFRDQRVIHDPIYYPLPDSPMVNTMCGAPAAEEAGCVNIDTGFFGELIFVYGAGGSAEYPPAGGVGGMNINFYRGGTDLAHRIFTLSSFGGHPGTWSYTNAGGICTQVTCKIDTTAIATDPFADGLLFDQMHIQQQYAAGTFEGSLMGGYSIAAVYFKLPNETPILLSVINGSAGDYNGIPYGPGTSYFKQGNLWPEDTDFVL